MRIRKITFATLLLASSLAAQTSQGEPDIRRRLEMIERGQGDAVSAEETLLHIVPAQRGQAINSQQGGGLPAHNAARHDDRHVGSIEELLRNGEAVGDDGQVTASLELLSDGERCAAGIEYDGFAVLHECRRCCADASLFGDLLLATERQRQHLQA